MDDLSQDIAGDGVLCGMANAETPTQVVDQLISMSASLLFQQQQQRQPKQLQTNTMNGMKDQSNERREPEDDPSSCSKSTTEYPVSINEPVDVLSVNSEESKDLTVSDPDLSVNIHANCCAAVEAMANSASRMATVAKTSEFLEELEECDDNDEKEETGTRATTGINTRPLYSSPTKRTVIAPSYSQQQRECHHPENHWTSEDSEDIDEDEFLDYAREVVAINNTSFDSAAFRDFENLLQQQVDSHFLDDDTDQDSMASISSFSGYMNDGSRRQKATLLKKPIISEKAYHRMASMIARKKAIDEKVGSASVSADQKVMSSPRNMCKIDDSDDSTVATSTVSLYSLARSRNSRGKRLLPKQSSAYEYDLDNSLVASDDSSSNIESRPRRQRRRPIGKIRSKEGNSLPPVAPSTKRSRSRPPMSPISRTDTLSGALQDLTFNISQGLTDTGSMENVHKISTLLTSPGKKEQVLDYLKSRAPGLHDSVLTRLQLESMVISEEKSSKSGNSNSTDENFRTPEKQRSHQPVVSSSSTLTSPESVHDSSRRLNVEVILSKSPNGDKVVVQEAIVDRSSVIFPTKARAVLAAGASSTDTDLMQGIDTVLREKQRKQDLRMHKCNVLNELVRVAAEREEQATTRTTEHLSKRGMALIHKFRARRKAALRSHFLQQSEKGQTTPSLSPSAIVSSCCPPPSNNPVISVGGTPEDLESYLSGGQSNSATKSPSSPLEEKKLRLRSLKEKRKRSLALQFTRQGSQESLLRSDELDKKNREKEVIKQASSSDEGSILSKASPFKTNVFSRARQSDTNYEVLQPSPASSPLSGLSSPRPRSTSSSSSTSGKRRKDGTFFVGGELNARAIHNIIAPETSAYLSPIRGYQVSDLSAGNSSSDRIPTIVEDVNSNEEDGLIPSTCEGSDDWDKDISFQSDPNLFAESSSSCFSKQYWTRRPTKVPSPKHKGQIEKTPSPPPTTKAYNDSFDEILFRQTPGQKIAVAPTDQESPTGVIDLFSTHMMFSPQEKPMSVKAIDLAFVDEEERDPVFVDRDHSSDALSSENSEVGALDPVFLSTRMFEI